MRRKWIAALVLGIMLSTSVGTAGAANTNTGNLEQQRQDLEKEKQNVQQQLNTTKKEKNKVVAELEKVNKQMNDVQATVNSLNTEITDTEEKITFTTTEIENKQRDYDGRMAIFNRRLKEMYEYGDVNYIEVLLNASSLKDFLTRFDYLRYIANNDRELLDEVVRLRTSLEEEKQSLEDMKASLEEKKQAQLEKNAELEQVSAQKQSIVKEMNKQQDLYYEMLDAIEQESKAIEEELRRIQAANGNSVAPSGYLWPCPSSHTISSEYGMRYHPTKKVNKLHTGMDIAAKYGANVVAAASGTVIKSEYYGSYGNCIIIDHGGSMSTLYGHMSSLVAKKGDFVVAGQVIGKVGSTGASTGNHLHIEFRKNGATQNPRNYIK